MSSELVQVVDTLTKKELNRIKFLLNNQNVKDKFKPSEVFSDGKNSSVNANVRSSTSVSLDDNCEVAEIIHNAMNKALVKYHDELYNINPMFCQFPVPSSLYTNCWRESIQLLRYEKTQNYNWHVDQNVDQHTKEYHRTISIVTYLQNADEGGRTLFTHRAYKPKEGQSVIFPSNWCFPHSGEPVQKGVKIVAVTWYHSHYNFEK